MSRRSTALFVQQGTYKRRRMADAARILPVFGGLLFMLPLLWITDAGTARTGAVMIYLFVVWAGLAGIAAVLSRKLGPPEDDGDAQDDG